MRRKLAILLAGMILLAGPASAEPTVPPADIAAQRIIDSISQRLPQYETRAVERSIAEARAMSGTRRLRRLFYLMSDLSSDDYTPRSLALLHELKTLASSEHQQRYERLAEVDQTASDATDYAAMTQALEHRFFADPDWLVRVYAMQMSAPSMAFVGRTYDALVMLDSARRLVPAGDPDAAFVLQHIARARAFVLARIGDVDGAVRDLSDAEFQFKGSASLGGMGELNMLWVLGMAAEDEMIARRALSALDRFRRAEGKRDAAARSIHQCQSTELLFGRPQRVLACTAGLNLRDPAFRDEAQVTYANRGLAYAQLGRTAEAAADADRVRALSERNMSPTLIPGAIRLDAWLAALQGHPVEAVARLDDYWRRKSSQRSREIRSIVPQLTAALQRDLDLSRRNEQQQHLIILFQWVMGAVAALICAAAIAVLMWQRRLNARLVAANARAEAAQHRAEEANALKSQFLANVSHEVRPPLNGVLGMIQAIAADELSPVQRERLEVLRGSSRGMLAILNDLLDLAKIEAGKLTLESVEFDLAPVAEGSRHAFWAAAEAKGLALELTVEEDARGLYRGDPTRLRQIVDNLVSNAIKFTGEGGVFVTFAAMGAGEGLRLSVRDTGIGMTAEQAAKIFSKFEQAEASTTRKYGGTGLGLSICRELVQAFGGEITVSSAPGEGTVFMADLPLPRIGDSPDVGAEDALAEVAGLEDTGEGLRILAAEDHPVNQLVLRTLLSQLGCEVTMTGDGAQALEAFRTGRWDVVLMDIQMPVMDGIEAARAIRSLEREAGLARTSLVALTANAMPDQIAEYRAAGFDDHLSKPIDAQDLLTVLNRALAGYAEVPELAVA